MEWQRQLSCGKLFDGLSDTIRGPPEILIEDDAIAEVNEGRPHLAPWIAGYTSLMNLRSEAIVR
jgi:hypothetical protein